ncbi:PAS domain S-box protein, partial [Halapricum sp. CBA1109]|nr:PAS domain S-box protein [Halapricum sp. CBA1109]
MSGDDGQAIRVLHVDDEPNFADLVATYLERANDAFSVVTATSAPEGLDRLDEHRVDCIVSDLDMPEMDGLEFLRAVREEYPDLPFVLFTGKGSEEIASDAISAGVTEYLQKESGTDQYTVLANRIERAVEAYRAKDALEESERMLSTLVSNLPGMAYRCRNAPDWPMEYVSDGCRDLTGYDPEELVDSDVVWAEDVLLEEDLKRLWETVQAALDSGESFEVTYRIRTADGETKRVWEQGQGVYEDGDLIALEGIILHIDSPAVRQATRLSDEDGSAAVRSARFEAAVERIDDAFVAVDADRTVTYANEAAGELLGMAPDSIVGTDLCTVVPDGYDDTLRSQLEQSIATGDPVRSETRYPSSDRWIELNIYPAEDGASLYARDITDRRERSTELERYRTLVENVGDPMYVLDTEATITMVNEAMADHLGYDREEIVGSHASMFMPESDVQTGTETVRRLDRGRGHVGDFRDGDGPRRRLPVDQRGQDSRSDRRLRGVRRLGRRDARYLDAEGTRTGTPALRDHHPSGRRSGVRARRRRLLHIRQRRRHRTGGVRPRGPPGRARDDRRLGGGLRAQRRVHRAVAQRRVGVVRHLRGGHPHGRRRHCADGEPHRAPRRRGRPPGDRRRHPGHLRAKAPREAPPEVRQRRQPRPAVAAERHHRAGATGKRDRFGRARRRYRSGRRPDGDADRGPADAGPAGPDRRRTRVDAAVGRRPGRVGAGPVAGGDADRRRRDDAVGRPRPPPGVARQPLSERRRTRRSRRRRVRRDATGPFWLCRRRRRPRESPMSNASRCS